MTKFRLLCNAINRRTGGKFYENVSNFLSIFGATVIVVLLVKYNDHFIAYPFVDEGWVFQFMTYIALMAIMKAYIMFMVFITTHLRQMIMKPINSFKEAYREVYLNGKTMSTVSFD